MYTLAGWIYKLYMRLLAVFCTNSFNILADLNGSERCLSNSGTGKEQFAAKRTPTIFSANYDSTTEANKAEEYEVDKNHKLTKVAIAEVDTNHVNKICQYAHTP